MVFMSIGATVTQVHLQIPKHPRCCSMTHNPLSHVKQQTRHEAIPRFFSNSMLLMDHPSTTPHTPGVLRCLLPACVVQRG
jgi:hypothetical protein